ncbi:MAG: ferredoxin family protein [Anaerolineae bacterium]|nr:ferredoxin family protein [Anaerolineae bacterium]
MAYVIVAALCKRAGDCADVCPTDSIKFVDGDSDWPKYYINPDTCIDCGACMAECPNEAIFPDDEAEDAEGYDGDIERNAAFFEAGLG